MAAMQIIIYLAVFALTFSSPMAKSDSNIRNKDLKNFVEFYENLANKSEDSLEFIINHDGYPVEMYNVTTKDGYILTCARIPRGQNKPLSTKGPVIISPGFGATAASWLISWPNSSLPYLLADRGYDVWLVTYRGFPISGGHVKYTQKDAKYWDYSLDEEGLYDVPAVVDLVLNKTGQKQLSVVCHSIGCAYFYMVLSTNISYNNNINKIVNLSPAVYVSHVKSPLWGRIARISSILKGLPKAIQPGHGAVPFSKNIFSFGVQPCSSYRQWKICLRSYAYEMGFVPSQQNDMKLYKAVAIVKTKFGRKMLEHVFQLYRTGIFRRYDYGERKNKKIYGTRKPPKYDLSLVKIPSVLTIVGHDDKVTVMEDVQKFHQELSASIHKTWKVVKDPKFAHTDFMLHDNIKTLVFDDVINFLDNNN